MGKAEGRLDLPSAPTLFRPQFVPKSDSRLPGGFGRVAGTFAPGVNTSSGLIGVGVGSVPDFWAASGEAGSDGTSLSNGAPEDITPGSDTALLGIAVLGAWQATGWIGAACSRRTNAAVRCRSCSTARTLAHVGSWPSAITTLSCCMIEPLANSKPASELL